MTFEVLVDTETLEGWAEDILAFLNGGIYIDLVQLAVTCLIFGLLVACVISSHWVG